MLVFPPSNLASDMPNTSASPVGMLMHAKSTNKNFPRDKTTKLLHVSPFLICFFLSP